MNITDRPYLAMHSLSREEVREIDRRAIESYGLPGIVLMENAARGAVDLLVSMGIVGRVVICCGKGNNGGDGFAMARQLEYLGFDVLVCLLGDSADLSGDAATNCEVLKKGETPILEFPFGETGLMDE